MVCAQQTTITNRENTTKSVDNRNSISAGETTKLKKTHYGDKEMDFTEDFLELQHLTGGNIVKYAPIFSENGDHLFLRSGNLIKVYFTQTGEFTRHLLGATSDIISMQLELKQPEELVACTVEGEVLRWRWRTGDIQKSLKLELPPTEPVVTFNLINYYGNSETACAFVIRKPKVGHLLWCVVDTSTGKTLKVPSSMILKIRTPIVDVGVKDFKYIMVAQGFYIYFLNYKNWQWTRYKNANQVNITAVRSSPVEEMVATGDEIGRIFLWREFGNQKTVKNTLYHWHHTLVTSIAFSASGTSFYSSGLEAVLVKWNVARPELRQFLPRMASIIRHVAVSGANEHVVVCTDDNGVQFVGPSDNSLKSTLQDFTYATDDKTGKGHFPIGLHLNPRTNTMVLNGRMGHLQFYSTYSKTLLYNLRVVDHNKLSMETDKILYDTRVTNAAFNIDWMATVESFDDEEHLPEIRLKFWQFNENLQRYELNTMIEMPHEGSVKAIAFSNSYQVDNLLCATVGEDRSIRMWSLENSDNIYKKGKVWYCIAETKYKDMPIESISFSEDGSILAAGHGNTLCIYVAETLKLKAALTGSAGFDGVVNKAQLRFSTQPVNGSKNEYMEQRKKLWQLFTKLLESNDHALITEIERTLKVSEENQVQQTPKPCDVVQNKNKALIYTKIRQMNELNLFQKLQLFQKLDIRCDVQEQWKSKMIGYLQDTVAEKRILKRTVALQAKVHCLNTRQRFKAKYRLAYYTRRKRNYDAEIAQNLVPIMSVLNLGESTKAKQAQHTQEQQSAQSMSMGHKLLPPLQLLADIRHVEFAAGQYAHLVTVCTETRVLVWNLLTLRLQSSLKLSVKHLTFDPQTNLLAAITKNDELYVFQPSVPLPIYQRSNLPKLLGMIWMPRRQPKQRSINVDWQAYSTLYFLTEDQEIKFLGSSDATDFDCPAPVTFNVADKLEAIRYTTFGNYATNKHSDVNTANTSHQNGPLIIGRSGQTAVTTLVDMTTHTMPPLNLICGEFIKSMLKPAESNTAHAARTSSTTTTTTATSNRLTNGYYQSGFSSKNQMNGYATHENSDTDDDIETTSADALETRRTILGGSSEKSKKFVSKSVEPAALLSVEAQLERIAAQSVEFDFATSLENSNMLDYLM